MCDFQPFGYHHSALFTSFFTLSFTFLQIIFIKIVVDTKKMCIFVASIIIKNKKYL